MATYKKRAIRKVKSTSPLKEIEKESTTAEVFNALDEGASVSERWVEKNQKFLLALLVVITLSILSYLAYDKYIATPYEKEAADELSFPKQTFEQALKIENKERDSILDLALQGKDGKYGFLDIADEYSKTKAGNLANYYAGIAYINKKEYQNAIDILKKFETEDLFLSTAALIATGDAFVNLDNKQKGLEYYTKAINHSENEALTPIALFKAANLALNLKQKEKAIHFFEQIKEKYSKLEIAKDIEKHINKAKYTE